MELIRPAREGTLRVLRAAAAAGSVTRVVVTSSAAAVAYGHDADRYSESAPAFTEEDWSVVETSKAYYKSKVRVRRGCAESSRLCPSPVGADAGGEGGVGLCAGGGEHVRVLAGHRQPHLPARPAPQRAGSHLSGHRAPSADKVCAPLPSVPVCGTHAVRRDMPGCPALSLGVVDVRDVALAHVRAMERQEAADQRFLCSSSTVWMSRMGQGLASEFSPMGYQPATRQLPNWLIRVASWCDPSLRLIMPDVCRCSLRPLPGPCLALTAFARPLAPQLGRWTNFDSSKAQRELDVTFRALDESLADMGHALILHGALPPTREPVRSRRNLLYPLHPQALCRASRATGPSARSRSWWTLARRRARASSA